MADEAPPATDVNPRLPRVTITYCTQCKWMLRAAYFAQELLSTFGTALGEVALRPATGGLFTVDLVPSATADAADSDATRAQQRRIWDRKTDGGFPEVKELKRRVRDVIAPERDLGHVDKHAKAAGPAEAGDETEVKVKGSQEGEKEACEDCKT